jgi:hypothetical protein
LCAAAVRANAGWTSVIADFVIAFPSRPSRPSLDRPEDFTITAAGSTVIDVAAHRLRPILVGFISRHQASRPAW